MESDAPILMNDNTLRPVFNIADFEHDLGFVTFADLKKYANLYTSNFFRATNYFLGGLNFTGYINNVSDATFDFLKNVSADIQEQFNTITIRLQNFVYDEATNNQYFTTFTAFQKVATNDISTNNLINNSLLTNDITTQNLKSTIIKCNIIMANNLPVLYINQYPIIDNVLLSQFNLGALNTISLQKGYIVKFYDNNKIPILTFTNNQASMLYFNNVDLTNAISLIIFKI